MWVSNPAVLSLLKIIRQFFKSQLNNEVLWDLTIPVMSPQYYSTSYHKNETALTIGSKMAFSATLNATNAANIITQIIISTFSNACNFCSVVLLVTIKIHGFSLILRKFIKVN
jgi:hypothetical protein